MRRIERVKVNGLFGRINHDIRVRPSAPTILTAPNGAGKTHVLVLIRAALALDLKVLASAPFQALEIAFDDSTGLVINRDTPPDGDPRLRIIATRDGQADGSPVDIGGPELEELASELPPHIHPLGDGRWYDTRQERVISQEAIQRRYGVRVGRGTEPLFQNHKLILEKCSPPYPVLIDTKRLDAVRPPQVSRYDADVFRQGEGIVGAARINQYIAELRSQVIEARRSSIQATQSADLSFAARALAAASATVKEGPLHSRYDQIVERYEDLARNSLAIGEAPLEFPEKTTPTVRRILQVFLDDWEKRLQPLLPLNEKIKTLRRILDTKLEQSGKKTAMSPRGDLVFTTFQQRRIRVERLSSGEQHLVALFTLLLFSAEQGSLVLIDEPEISLHAAWKHAFLEDISRVAELADLQVILATHSTSIINGRWDLTEELSFSAVADEDISEPEGPEDEVEGDDFLE